MALISHKNTDANILLQGLYVRLSGINRPFNSNFHVIVFALRQLFTLWSQNVLPPIYLMLHLMCFID